MSKRRKARELTLQALYQYEMGQIPLDEILQFSWQDKRLPSDILDFARMLISGTIRNLEDVDKEIQSLASSWSVDKLAIVDKNILRLSLYSLKYLPEIPPNVVINEAIEIAKIFSTEQASKFINGVLDAYCKQNRLTKIRIRR